MSDRDHFAELSHKMLQKDDLAQQDRQFWVEYILRQLRGKDMIETYTLGDIIEWNFTGENSNGDTIIFTQEQLKIPISSIISTYNLIADPAEKEDVRVMHVDGTNVYVGGGYTTYKSVLCNGVFKFDTLSGGYYGFGNGLATANTVEGVGVNSTGTLYAAGALSNINGTGQQGGAAYWNGTTWVEIGSFAINECNHLVIDSDDNVYFGGSFTDVGDANGDKIVKWNGSAFSSLGSGLDGNCYGLAIDTSDNIYAVGAFTGNASKWSGSAWSSLGGTFDAAPDVVRVFGDEAYICGDFTTPYPSVVKWNGTEFSGFGGGGGINDIAVLSDGTVYGCAGTSVYYWSGSEWTAVATFTSASVTHICVDANDNIYIGLSYSP